MEKKIYKKPLINAVIDLGNEICDGEIIGETRGRIVDKDGNRVDGWGVTQETDEEGFWDGWSWAKKSTLWDDEEEE